MEGAWCQHPSWLYRRTGMQGGALPRLEPVGEGPFAYPLRACVFSLPAFELPPYSTLPSLCWLLPPCCQQCRRVPLLNKGPPIQLGNPPCPCLSSYPSLAQRLGRAPATVSLTSSPALFIADGLTYGSRVENTETKLGAASPPREWPNLYFLACCGRISQVLLSW